MQNLSLETILKARAIKLLLTDCDGVLTDGGVYYTINGEKMKKFSLRDGMGVERLRTMANIETGIITGESSSIVKKRAKKLSIKEYHGGVKNKLLKFQEIIARKKLHPCHVAYIGDDTNDLEIMQHVGLCACPADAFPEIIKISTIVVENKGGYGAFRDFAEILINCQLKKINFEANSFQTNVNPDILCEI